jgi:hypothetical protein
MKITVELNTVEEMEQFLEAWKAKKEPKQEGFDLKPMPMTESITPAVVQTEAPAPTPAASKQQPEPEKKTVSIEDVTKAAVKLMDAGRQDDLRQLLIKYGVQALPELKDKPDKLAAFYAELEVM